MYFILEPLSKTHGRAGDSLMLSTIRDRFKKVFKTQMLMEGGPCALGDTDENALPNTYGAG
eukprot:6204477-Pleurochrysis_carterae.AAC.1